MTVRFQCSCGHKLKTSNKELFGTSQPCTQCGNLVIVPERYTLTGWNLVAAVVGVGVLIKVAGLVVKKAADDNLPERPRSTYTPPPPRLDADTFRRSLDTAEQANPRATTAADDARAKHLQDSRAKLMQEFMKEGTPSAPTRTADPSGSAAGAGAGATAASETERLKELARHRDRLDQAVEKKIAEAAEKMGRSIKAMKNCCAPDSIARDPSLKQSRALLANVRTAVAVYCKDAVAICQWPPPGVESLPEQSLKELKAEWDQTLAEMRGLEFPEIIGIVESAEKVLDFLAAKRGHWEVQSSQMVFDNAADVKRFNELSNKVAEKEAALQAQ